MQGKLCDNGIFFIAEKSGNPVFVRMPQSKTEVKMTHFSRLPFYNLPKRHPI